MEKSFKVYAPIEINPPKNGRYDYDSYGTLGKYNRLSSKGKYSEIKLLSNERMIGDPNDFAKAISSKDTLIVGDLRLSFDTARTDAISKAINAKTKTDGRVLFIGNLLCEKYMRAWNMLMEFLNSIYSNKLYLILGNNDIFSIQDYINFGFSYVTDRAEKTVGSRRLIYTYYPVPVQSGQLNIHGHPSADMYRLISRQNHFDTKVISSVDDTTVYTLGEILKNS
jgi:hypothetical protein